MRFYDDPGLLDTLLLDMFPLELIQDLKAIVGLDPPREALNLFFDENETSFPMVFLLLDNVIPVLLDRIYFDKGV